MELLLTAIIISLTLILAFSDGANDESMSPLLGSGIFSMKAACIVGALSIIIGALLLTSRIKHTLSMELIRVSLSGEAVFIILVSSLAWLLVTAYMGWPSSLTQAIIGSAVSVALVKYGIHVIDANILFKLVTGWVLSPIIGLVMAFTIYKTLQFAVIKRIKTISERESIEYIAAVMLIPWSILMGASRCGNDLATILAYLPLQFRTPMMDLIGGGVVALGLLTLGRRVLRSMGFKLVKLVPSSSLSVLMSSSLIMFLATQIGIPFSATHVMSASIIGAGAARGSAVSTYNVLKLLVIWMTSFPAVFGISLVLAEVFL